MADAKISALPASTTPLAGTEVLPIVQSSTTKKVAVSDLTAGRNVSTAALTATGLITAPKGSTRGITIGDVTTNSGSVLRFQGTSAGYNWQVNNNISSSGLAFVQSSATGGTTYTNILFEMLNTGVFNVANGNLKLSTAAKGVDFSANTPAAGMTSQLLNWYEEGTWTPAQGSGLTLVGAFSSSGTYVRIGRMVTVTGLLQGATSIAVAAGGVITNNLPYSIGTGNAVGRCLDSAWTSACDIIPSAANLYGATAIGATSYIFFSITYQV